MGITKEYLDYLDREVGISPAGSQEELDCAQTLAQTFSSHGLDPKVEEFSVPSFVGVIHGAMMVAAFVGMLLSGLSGAASVVGILLAAASLVLLVMAYMGRDVLGGLGPAAHSQNVVAFHKAEGEEASKNRPIVILAHYDSPRVDLLSRPEVSVVKKYLATGAPYLVMAAALCLFVQLLVFIPAGARRTFWVIGIIALLPLCVWGVALIARRFAPYTSGSVDNKSSIAAMLGVLEHVRPSGVGHRVAEGAGQGASETVQSPRTDAADASGAAEKSSPAPESQPTVSRPAMRREVEKVVGKRHGKRVLTELGILPDSCEITYIEPEVRMVPVAGETTDLRRPSPSPSADPSATTQVVAPTVAPSTPVPSAAGPAATTRDVEAAATRNATSAATLLETPAEVSPDETSYSAETDGAAQDKIARDEQSDESAESSAAEDTAIMQGGGPADVSDGDSDDDGSDATRPAARLSLPRVSLDGLEDGQNSEGGSTSEGDQSGLSVMAEEDATQALEAPRSPRPTPAAPDDPEWGKSSFAPARRREISSIGRRASLFDLPDPLDDEQDALSLPSVPAAPAPASLSADQTSVKAGTGPRRVEYRQESVAERVVEQQEIRVLPSGEGARDQQRRKGISKLFGHRRRQEESSMSEWLGVESDFNAKESGESIGTWENFDNDEEPARGEHWKGGAALSLRLRELKKAAEGAVANARDAASHIGRGHDVQEEAEGTDAFASDDEAKQGDAPADQTVVSSVDVVPGRDDGQASPSADDTSLVDTPFSDDEDPDATVVGTRAEESGYEESAYGNDDEEGHEQSGSLEGGASGFDGTPVDEQVPSEEDMRDAVLAMDDKSLLSHDIWFVATGASAYGHAGAKEFVKQHRKDLRGAFVINLESVGAGELTLIMREGFGNSRRADRRLLSLLESVADDLHIDLARLARPWADTEATPLMRRSLRAVSVMGLGKNELPALSSTAEDTPEAVSERQVADVCALITEAIRRS